MAWSDVTGATTYTGWKTYEEKLDFTGTSSQTIYTSALDNFYGNVILSAAIRDCSVKLTVAANAVKVQISIDGTHWVDMQTGVTPGVTEADTGCGMMIDLRNIIAPFYRIAITLTPTATGNAVIRYAVKE